VQNVFPLLVAFLGALFGTYFALLKSRKERLWLDRYETLIAIADLLDIIKTKFLSLQAEELNLKAFTSEEKEHLETEWRATRRNLNSKMTKVRMLFEEREVSGLLAAHYELDKTILEALEGLGPDYNAQLNKVWTSVNETVDQAIAVARKKCL
jgi:hypothetical protein